MREYNIPSNSLPQWFDSVWHVWKLSTYMMPNTESWCRHCNNYLRQYNARLHHSDMQFIINFDNEEDMIRFLLEWA